MTTLVAFTLGAWCGVCFTIIASSLGWWAGGLLYKRAEKKAKHKITRPDPEQQARDFTEQATHEAP